MTTRFASESSPEVKMTVFGFLSLESSIHAIGMLLIDLTTRAPGAHSAINSLEVRPVFASAARDLVTPSRLMSGALYHERIL
jgi:hypothetical protein